MTLPLLSFLLLTVEENVECDESLINEKFSIQKIEEDVEDLFEEEKELLKESLLCIDNDFDVSQNIILADSRLGNLRISLRDNELIDLVDEFSQLFNFS